MPIVCGVRFRGVGKVYFFDPGELAIEIDDHVIVETSRGDELGQVTSEPHEIEPHQVVGELKPVLRKANSLDLLEAEHYHQKESESMAICQEQIERFGLDMKVVGAEYSYDGSRLTFFFTADNRVDFRALVRDLARTFKTRIELRQIGVRDEAKIVGGLGPCGRPLCCATWLTQFSPVSIRMAKRQNLPLSPMEISGLCGRLLCCLTYEDDYYRQIKGRFPKVGRTIDSPYGPARVIRVSVLKECVTLLLQNGETVEMTAEQLSGEEPLAPQQENDTRKKALDDTLNRAASDSSSDGNRTEGSGRRSGGSSSRGGSGSSSHRDNGRDGSGNGSGDGPSSRSRRRSTK